MNYQLNQLGSVKCSLTSAIILHELEDEKNKVYVNVPGRITVQEFIFSSGIDRDNRFFREMDEASLRGALRIWTQYIRDISTAAIFFRESTPPTAISSRGGAGYEEQNPSEGAKIPSTIGLRLDNVKRLLIYPDSEYQTELCRLLVAHGLSDEDVRRFTAGITDLYSTNNSFKSAADALFSAELAQYNISQDDANRLMSDLESVTEVISLVNSLQSLYGFFAHGSSISSVAEYIVDHLKISPLFEYVRCQIDFYNHSAYPIVQKDRAEVRHEIISQLATLSSAEKENNKVSDVLRPLYARRWLVDNSSTVLSTGLRSSSTDNYARYISSLLYPQDDFVQFEDITYVQLWNLYLKLKRGWMNIHDSHSSISMEEIVRAVRHKRDPLLYPRFPAGIDATDSRSAEILFLRYFFKTLLDKCFVITPGFYSSKIRGIMDDRKYLRDEKFESLLSSTLETGSVIIDAYADAVQYIKGIIDSDIIDWHIDSRDKADLDRFLSSVDEVGKTYTLPADHPRALFELANLNGTPFALNVAVPSYVVPDGVSRNLRWLFSSDESSTVAHLMTNRESGTWFGFSHSEQLSYQRALRWARHWTPMYMVTSDIADNYNWLSDVDAIFKILNFAQIARSGLSDFYFSIGSLTVFSRIEELIMRFNISVETALRIFRNIGRLGFDRNSGTFSDDVTAADASDPTTVSDHFNFQAFSQNDMSLHIGLEADGGGLVSDSRVSVYYSLDVPPKIYNFIPDGCLVISELGPEQNRIGFPVSRASFPAWLTTTISGVSSLEQNVVEIGYDSSTDTRSETEVPMNGDTNSSEAGATFKTSLTDTDQEERDLNNDQERPQTRAENLMSDDDSEEKKKKK